MEANWNVLIDRYLNNELSEEGKTAFEQELSSNTKLQVEFENTKTLREAILRKAQRKALVQLQKSVLYKKVLKVSAIVVISLSIIAATTYYFLRKEKANDNIEAVSTALIQQYESNLKFENIVPEYFEFTGAPSLFISKSGVILSIAANSFLLNGKEFKGETLIQWQEARTNADIMMAGLSTMSGNNLLETQGMFSLKAFTKEGKELKINDQVGVYVQVPIDELKSGMKLYQGVTKSDGGIDWQEPKEMEKLPILADMKELDFYPPGYEDKLNELNWNSQKVSRESLYLSFEENVKNAWIGQEIEPSFYENDTMIVGMDKFEIRYKSVGGRELFNRLCNTCHNIDRDGTGPKLAGVRERWKRDGIGESLLIEFVRNWSIAASKSDYAANISAQKAVAMSFFPELMNDEIDEIFDYIDSQSSHIPPSKVLTMWKPKFNNTNLSTRDFERRMKAVHKTCSKDVFDVYMNGINQSLWKSDEKIAKMGYSNFQRFADERVGKIDISNQHLKNLQQFYKNAVQSLANEAQKNSKKYRDDERNFQQKLVAKRSENTERNYRRFSQNLMEETSFNLKQVDYGVRKFVLQQVVSSVGFTITNSTAVCNIDRLVANNTASRKTGSVYNPETRKTYEIKYNKFKFKVKDANKFNKVFAYVLPDKLATFQRLELKNGSLDYSLNNFMNYKCYVIAQTESEFFFYEKMRIKGGDLGIITLNKSKKEFISARLSSIDANRSAKREFQEELDWLELEQTNQKRQTKRKAIQQLRETLYPIVYPCGMSELRFEETKIENQIDIGL